MPKPSEIIQERGWIQGNLQDSNGVCLLGAMDIACHGNVWTCSAFNCESKGSSLNGTLSTVLGERAYMWNNAPERTAEQVIALLQEYEVEFESEAVPEPEKEKELVTA